MFLYTSRNLLGMHRWIIMQAYVTLVIKAERVGPTYSSSLG